MTTLTLPRSNVPIDAAGNLPSQAMYRWMHDITERAGGVTGSGTNDLEVAQFEDAGIEETKAALFRLADQFDSAPLMLEQVQRIQELETQVSELTALLAELRKDVQGIQEGVSL